jgi:hypothetical protein
MPKGKVVPVLRYCSALNMYGGNEGKAARIRNFDTGWRLVAVARSGRSAPGAYWMGGDRVGPRAGLDAVAKTSRLERHTLRCALKFQRYSSHHIT